MVILRHRYRLPEYLVWFVLVIGLVIPSSARAFQIETGAGAHVRVAGDITIAEGETSDFVLVIQGNANISGTADVVVVIDGEARLAGGQVGRLIVIDGRADLTDDAEVSGDVTLIDAEISRAEGTSIAGAIEQNVEYWFGFGAAILGIAFAVGFGIVLLLSGLLVAALIPGYMRAAGTVLTNRVGPMVLAAVVVWIGLPVLGVASMVTIVGIPVGLTIFFLILPVLGFLGYLVTAIRLGDEILAAARGQAEPEHPYLGTIVGILALILISVVPIIGEIAAPVASLAGGGALALLVWERFRGGEQASERAAAAPEV